MTRLLSNREGGPVAFVVHTSAHPKVTGLQLSKIRSHASKAYQRRQRLNRVHENLRSVSLALLEQQNIDDSLPVYKASHFDLVGGGDAQYESRSKSLSYCARSHGKHKDRNASNYDQIRAHPMLRTTTAQFKIPSDSYRRDPFASFPLEGDRNVYLAIDHYVQVIAPDYGTWVSSDGQRNGCLDVVLPLSMQYKHLLHIVVAHTRLMHLIAAGKSPHHDQMVMYHHGQGLAVLQGALDDTAGDVDDAVPLAIVHLISFEWQLGDTDAMSLHYRGLQRLLNFRGTRMETPALKMVRLLMRSVHSTSVIRSANTASFASNPPRFSRSFSGTHFPAHPADAFSGQERALIALLPPGLKDVASMGLVSISTIKLLSELGDDKRLSPDDACPSAPSNSVVWARAYPLSNIHSYARHSQTILDRWLIWALLMHVFQTFEESYRKTIAYCAKNVVEDIITYLEDERSSTEMQQVQEVEAVRQRQQGNRCRSTRDCIIWALFCAAGASDLIRKDSEGETWGQTAVKGLTALDGDSVQLMKRARTMLDFEKGARLNMEMEWGTSEEVLARFWCPEWLQLRWEAIYDRMLKHHT